MRVATLTTAMVAAVVSLAAADTSADATAPRHNIAQDVARTKNVLSQLLQSSSVGQDLSSILSAGGDEIWEDAAGPIGCAACEAILAQLKLLAAAGDQFFISVVTELCKRSGVQDADVCEGSIALEGPIVARAVRAVGVGGRVSRLFCANALALCGYPEVEEWEVPLPPKVSHSSPESSVQGNEEVKVEREGGGNGAPTDKEKEKEKRKTLKIVHFSDIHVDPFYREGANANCTKPICCRDYSDTNSNSNLFVPADPKGDHKCDTPISLEESMYEAIRYLVPDASFSIFTGDIVDHAIWNTTQQQNTMNIDSSYMRMADLGFPVYGTAGNHESSPTNAFPPEGTSDSAQWLYNLLSLAWVRWVGTDAAEQARRLGAYSTLHTDTKLRVISLNTNLHYAHNYWLYEDPMQKDPSGQLGWLIGELDAAEKNGEAVYIIGHMPMGSADAFRDYSNYYDQIVQRYGGEGGVIRGQFFGHTHLDEFEIAYGDYDKRNDGEDGWKGAMGVTYIAPSLTPSSGNPSFRVYEVDAETFGVVDVTTYRVDMDGKAWEVGWFLWEKYYSAREAYGSLVSPPLEEGMELTGAFWHNVTAALERNQTAFSEYYGRKRRGWMEKEEVKACGETCRKLEICKLRAARAQDNCVLPAIRLNLGRVKPPMDEEDECESSVVRDTLLSVGVQRKLLLMTMMGGVAETRSGSVEQSDGEQDEVEEL